MPYFAHIEHAIGIGIAAVEAARFEHRDSTGIGQRVGYHDIGQGGFAIVTDVDRVIGHVARAIDHRGRTGGVAAIRAVGDIDEGLVNRDVRNREVVTDRIDLNGRAYCCVGRNDHRLIIAGGLGRSSRIHFIDEIGPIGLYPIERITTVCIGDCGLQDLVTGIQHAVFVGIFVKIHCDAADKCVSPVFNPIAVDITEFGALKHHGILRAPFLKSGISVVGAAREPKRRVKIQKCRRWILAGKRRYRNQHRQIRTAAARRKSIGE